MLELKEKLINELMGLDVYMSEAHANLNIGVVIKAVERVFDEEIGAEIAGRLAELEIPEMKGTLNQLDNLLDNLKIN